MPDDFHRLIALLVLLVIDKQVVKMSVFVVTVFWLYDRLFAPEQLQFVLEVICYLSLAIFQGKREFYLTALA